MADMGHALPIRSFLTSGTVAYQLPFVIIGRIRLVLTEGGRW
jgi:hypothetical protein